MSRSSNFRDENVLNKDAQAELPPKEEGKHRWTVLVCYTVTDKQLIAASRGSRVNLDEKNRLWILQGCIDCELPFTEAVKVPCSASGYRPGVDDPLTAPGSPLWVPGQSQ